MTLFNQAVLEQPVSGPRRLGGNRFEGLSAPGEAVGLLLPNSNGVAMSLIGLVGSGRVAAMLNYTAGPANVTAAVRTAVIRTVISSRAFVDKANLADIAAAIEEGGARIVWLEDIRKDITRLDKALAALLWRLPLARWRLNQLAPLSPQGLRPLHQRLSQAEAATPTPQCELAT